MQKKTRQRFFGKVFSRNWNYYYSLLLIARIVLSERAICLSHFEATCLRPKLLFSGAKTFEFCVLWLRTVEWSWFFSGLENIERDMRWGNWKKFENNLLIYLLLFQLQFGHLTNLPALLKKIFWWIQIFSRHLIYSKTHLIIFLRKDAMKVSHKKFSQIQFFKQV